MRLSRASSIACLAVSPALACTLIESTKGLVGPPVTGDAGDARVTGDAADASLSDVEEDAPDVFLSADGRSDAAVPEASPPADGNPGGAVVLYSDVVAPRGIALYATEVCWVGGQAPRGLFCAPKTGGDAGASRIDTPADGVFLTDAYDLALDDSYVYWSDGSGNRVIRKPRQDGGPAAEYFSGDIRVSFLALDGEQVWATDFLDSPEAGAGNVVVGPTDGGTTSTEVYPNPDGPTGVAVAAGIVYWGRARRSTLAFGPVAGNVIPTEVTSPGGMVAGVAVDAAQTVYFLAGGQQVFRLPSTSNTAQSMYVESTVFGVGDVAVDDSFVYWTEPDLGKIMRMPK